MCATSSTAAGAAGRAGHVVVIGAGVIGLQTALTLLRASYAVTIIAREFPGDESPGYTSPWAGAQWRTHASDEEVREQRWDMETYEYWMGLVEGVEDVEGHGNGSGDVAGEKFGLNAVESRFYWNSPNTTTDTTPKLPYFHTKVRNFRLLSPQTGNPNDTNNNNNTDFLPPGATHGASYTSFAITPSIYLSYLVSEIKAFTKTARLVRATLQGPIARALGTAAELVRDGNGDEVKANVDVFVVCTGLESASLIPDADMYAVRGQTMLVKDLKAAAAAAATSKGSSTDAANTAAPTNTSSTTTTTTTTGYKQPPLRIMHTYDNALIQKVTYIIPRPGQPHTYLIGGTKVPMDLPTPSQHQHHHQQENKEAKGQSIPTTYDFSPLTIPDPLVSTDIATRCAAVLPAVFGGWVDGGNVQVISTMVGLRPGRKGGARVEVVEGGVGVCIGIGDASGGGEGGREAVEGNKEKKMKQVNVVFSYGHAGAGYQNSVGCAREVLGLVEGLVRG